MVTTNTKTAAKEVTTYVVSSDNTTSGARSIAPDTAPDAEEVPTDAGSNDCGEWKPDEWYWNEEYETWVYVAPKRIRPRDLTNKMEKNWLLGMRRNWNTAKKDKMLAAITITRANYHLVSMATFYITKPYNMVMLVITFYELSQAYRKLYEEGVCIVEDFFDDPQSIQSGAQNDPPPLFSCSTTQAQFITKTSISRETIFDGVKRSTHTCGYDTHIQEPPKTKKKIIKGPGPRQQLKHCKVIIPPSRNRQGPTYNVTRNIC